MSAVDHLGQQWSWPTHAEGEHELAFNAPIHELRAVMMRPDYQPGGPEWDKLAADVAQQGVQRPVVVNNWPQGDRTMTDGHHRLIAAERAGQTHLPVRLFAATEEGRSRSNRAILGWD